jgi:hypothetical protein
MKKNIKLVLAIAIISILGWYTYSLMKNSGSSNTELISFNIEDISTVDKFIISDPFGNKMEIVKNGNIWTDKDGGCVQQPSIDFILEAFKNIEFKGYLPEAARENQIKMMSAEHTKVEIFQNGEWTKTWYIGASAQDHLGQIMLLDSDEYGKSDLPVVMKIKGQEGIIEPRFFADPKKWMCTNIFAVDINKISKVDVKYLKEPSRSFSVTKKGLKMDVFQQGKKLEHIDTSMIFSYLNNFKKIHFEIANYTLSNKQVDSLKRTTPFAILKLKETSNKTTTLKMFTLATDEPQQNEFGIMEDADMDKFWCQLPNGEIVKCQYFVFNPILLGHIYFPMNLDVIKKAQGMK